MGVMSAAGAPALSGFVSGIEVPVFYAGIVQNLPAGERPRLVLHTADRRGARRLRGEAEPALARLGIQADIEVRVHGREFAQARSLESLVRPFKGQRAVADPTGAVTRARGIVCCARFLRARLGDRLAGVYFEPVRRTFYVILDRSRFQSQEREDADARRAALRLVATTIRSWRRGEKAFDMQVRVGYALPRRMELVPVEEASVPSAARSWVERALPRSVAASVAAGLAAMFGLGAPPQAMAEGPAVSGPNGKLSLQGGAVDGDGTGLVVGSGSLPLGRSFGAQLDGAAGAVDGDFYGAVGGHIFWRDPEAALVGLTASHATLDDTDMQRYGAEAELYLPQVTFGVRAGYQTGDVDNGFFGNGDVSWYVTDDLRLSIGGGYASHEGFGRAGVEFQPGIAALPGLAFFADGEVGENGYDRVLAGFRYYFGDTKSLKLRHRQDDPGDIVTDFQPFNEEQDDHHHKSAYGGNPG